MQQPQASSGRLASGEAAADPQRKVQRVEVRGQAANSLNEEGAGGAFSNYQL